MIGARFKPCGTIGSEIILDAPNGNLGDGDQVEARFSTFEDSVSTSAR